MKRLTGIAIILAALAIVAASCSSGSATPAPGSTTTAPGITSTASGETTTATPPASWAPAPAQTMDPPVPPPSGAVKVTKIEVKPHGNLLAIPLSTVKSRKNTEFMADAGQGPESFMAYIHDNQLHIRASICVPCQGKTFTLKGDLLVCDTCGTTFSASTGDGVAGACMRYPKAQVGYQIEGDRVLMSKSDLLIAYKNTIGAGWP